MTYDRKLRIALFAESTLPQGSVNHTLELARALHEDGHDVVVHAPDASGRGFIAARPCRQRLIRSAPVESGGAALVRTRVAEITSFLRREDDVYDIYHAHDFISGAALAELADSGSIPFFVRTVHHLDQFDEVATLALQDRSLLASRRCLCTSRSLRVKILNAYGIEAAVIPSGVDTRRFTPVADARDRLLRNGLQLGDGPVYLAFGGVEPTNDIRRVIQAFVPVIAECPGAQLVIAGNHALRDDAARSRELEALIADSGIVPGRSLVPTGLVPEDQMPALYRLADALISPAARQGLSLTAIEAMACGTPVIAPAEAPFTEYLSGSSAILIDRTDVAALTGAMRQVTSPLERRRLGAAGLRLSSRFSWSDAATVHVVEYCDLLSGYGAESVDSPLSAIAN